MAKPPSRNAPRQGQTRRRSPSQERSIELVRALLDATAQVLTEVGVEGLSTNKVARRANVAVGSIYQYFPNKEALVDALVRDRMERLGELVRTRMADLGTQTFSAAAETMLRAVIDFLTREYGLVPVLMSQAFSTSDKGLAGQLRTEAEALARAFLEGLGEGAVADLDVAVFVSTNVAGLFGALLADPRIDADYRDRAVTEIVRMLSSWMSLR